MPFEGGSTIVGDLRRLKIRYCVRKNVRSATRQTRQPGVRRVTASNSLRTTYFGSAKPGEPRPEPFAAMHRGLER